MATWTEEHEDLDACSEVDRDIVETNKSLEEHERQKLIYAEFVQQNIQFSRTAEVNRSYIFFVFDSLRSGMLHKYKRFEGTPFADLKLDSWGLEEIPLEFKGLYLLYECDGKDKFPFYIGYTGQSFRARFRIHRDRGAIQAFLGIKKEGSMLKADLIPTFFPMHAKLLESVFLLSFDFCMNKEENGAVRNHIEYDVPQHEHEISKRYFDIAYNYICGEVGFLNDYYQKCLIQQ